MEVWPTCKFSELMVWECYKQAVRVYRQGKMV